MVATHSASQILQLLMMLLTFNGPRDLVSYIPTDAYWQSKSVTMNVDAMVAALAEPKQVDAAEQIVALGDSDPKVRTAAANKLAALGPAVVEQLKTASAGDDPEIAALAKSLLVRIADASHGLDVRRLMAIRSLGELKDARAVAALRPLLKSTRPFEPEYVRAALASINHQPATRPAFDSPRQKALMLLPESCAAVGWLDLSVFPCTDALRPYSAAASALRSFTRDGAIEPSKADAQNLIIEIAERAGDLRIDQVTVGLDGGADVRGDPRFGMIIFDGEGDFSALRKAIEHYVKTGTNRSDNDQVNEWERESVEVIDGIDAVTLDPGSAILFDNKRMAMIGHNSQEKDVIPAAAHALRTGKGTLASSKDMAKLLAAADPKAPIWMTMRVTPAYTQLPVIRSLKTLTLRGTIRDGQLDLQVDAHGDSALDVTAAMVQIKAGAASMSDEISREMARGPMAQGLRVRAKDAMQPLLDGINAVKATNKGVDGKITTTVEPSAFGRALDFVLERESDEMNGLDTRPMINQPATAPATQADN